MHSLIWVISLLFLYLYSCEPAKDGYTRLLISLQLDPPAFDQMKESDQVNLMRECMAMYAHRALDERGEISFDRIFPDWRQCSPPDLLMQMDTTVYHISCGRLSYLLRDAYRKLGFHASTYNFGIQHTQFTHELTLVELSNGLVSVQDAHFNSALFKGDSLGDFFEFLQAVAGGSTHDFYFLNDTAQASLYLPETYMDSSYEVCNPAYVSGKAQPSQNPSWHKRDYMVNLQVNLLDSCYGFMTNLNKELAIQLDFEDLFLSRISGMSGHPEWEQRVDAILASARID